MFEGCLCSSPDPKWASRPDPSEPEPDRGARTGKERKKILVIEDDAIVSLSIENILTEAGYVVLSCCARGEDALAIAEQQGPDLILADVKLAGALDGIAAAATIRDRREVPVIFMTAHTDPVTRERMRAVGAAEILAKPVSDFLLVQAVGAALER
jgi:CheY-like chemotaxis protein